MMSIYMVCHMCEKNNHQFKNNNTKKISLYKAKYIHYRSVNELLKDIEQAFTNIDFSCDT